MWAKDDNITLTLVHSWNSKFPANDIDNKSQSTKVYLALVWNHWYLVMERPKVYCAIMFSDYPQGPPLLSWFNWDLGCDKLLRLLFSVGCN